MADPIAYEISYSFTGFQAASPDEPLPATFFDVELQNIETAMDSNRLAIMDIRKSDGTLQNGIVTAQSLASDFLTGIPEPSAWVTATEYEMPATVFNGPKFYLLLVDHASGTFATDLAADKWVELADFTPPGTVAASAVTFSPTGTIASTSTQDAVAEVATDAAAALAVTDAVLTALGITVAGLAAGTGDLAALDTVDTAQINNDSITGDKIADDAVALSQQAHGTRGGTIYYGASGAPTQLAAGTAAQVLTTAGTSADPAWAWEHVVQTVYAAVTATTNVTGTIPEDNSVPTSGEGTQAISAAITPKSTAHKIVVSGVINVGSTNSTTHFIAIFRGSTCIQVISESIISNAHMSTLAYEVVDSPASVSALTYSVRCGTAAGSVTLLNSDGTARLFGGAAKCTLMLQEVR